MSVVPVKSQLIGPSTVALIIPLYKKFHLMKHHARSIPNWLDSGSYCEYDFASLIAKAFGMKYFKAISLFPQNRLRLQWQLGLLKKWNYDHRSCGSCGNWIINKCLGS